MFHKIKTSKVLYAFFGILVLYFFSYSFFWQPFIIKQVNSALNKFDISVQSVNMSGNLLFDIKGRELQVTHPSLGNIFIDNFTINVDYASSLFGVTSFDKIFIEGILIDSTRQSFENNNFKIQEFPIKIDRFSLGGQIPIQFQKEVMLLNGYVEGKVLWKDELKLDLTRLSLKNKGDNSILFQMDDFDLIANTDSLIIKSFSGKIGNAPVKGKMVYLEKEEKILGSLDIAEFAISKELFSKTPLKGKFEKISGKVDFRSIKGNINGELSISNELGLKMAGDINIVKSENNILLKSLNLNGEDSNLRVNGVWENGLS